MVVNVIINGKGRTFSQLHSVGFNPAHKYKTRIRVDDSDKRSSLFRPRAWVTHVKILMKFAPHLKLETLVKVKKNDVPQTQKFFNFFHQKYKKAKSFLVCNEWCLCLQLNYDTANIKLSNKFLEIWLPANWTLFFKTVLLFVVKLRERRYCCFTVSDIWYTLQTFLQV